MFRYSHIGTHLNVNRYLNDVWILITILIIYPTLQNINFVVLILTQNLWKKKEKCITIYQVKFMHIAHIDYALLVI